MKGKRPNSLHIHVLSFGRLYPKRPDRARDLPVFYNPVAPLRCVPGFHAFAIAIDNEGEHFAASGGLAAPLFDSSDDGLELIAFFELVNFPAFGRLHIILRDSNQRNVILSKPARNVRNGDFGGTLHIGHQYHTA